MLSGLTLPPYRIRISAAPAAPESASRRRISPATRLASVPVAVCPVPIAHTGS